MLFGKKYMKMNSYDINGGKPEVDSSAAVFLRYADPKLYEALEYEATVSKSMKTIKG